MEFVERAIAKHGEKYDYSKVVYKSNKTKVQIVCAKHGDFWQIPRDHLKGMGCRLCQYESQSIRQLSSLDKFLVAAKELHGDKYDYSRVAYKGRFDKIIIVCPTHGPFRQIANNHLKKQKPTGCPVCGIERSIAGTTISNSKRQLDTTQFIANARAVHGDKYDYSRVEYVNDSTKVILVCQHHGDFWTNPGYHIRNKHGCPKCNFSKSEILIQSVLTELGIDYVREHKFPEFSKFKAFDFYLPKYKTVIEYEGEFHFKPVFGAARLAKQQEIDVRKQLYCENNGIRLIQVIYTEPVVETLKFKLMEHGICSA